MAHRIQVGAKVRVVDAITVIAAPRRREILRLIWDRELSAGDIAAALPVTFGAVSQHLRSCATPASSTFDRRAPIATTEPTRSGSVPWRPSSRRTGPTPSIGSPRKRNARSRQRHERAGRADHRDPPDPSRARAGLRVLHRSRALGSLAGHVGDRRRPAGGILQVAMGPADRAWPKVVRGVGSVRADRLHLGLGEQPALDHCRRARRSSPSTSVPTAMGRW